MLRVAQSFLHEFDDCGICAHSSIQTKKAALNQVAPHLAIG